MYNIEKSQISSTHEANHSDPIPTEKKLSLLFNLGIIAYQLLTGKKAITGETEEQYNKQLSDLERDSLGELSTITMD
jgi:hypothetical protein